MIEFGDWILGSSDDYVVIVTDCDSVVGENGSAAMCAQLADGD